MRVQPLLLVSALLSASALASSDVEITEVGLKGYYSSVLPTPVTLQVKAPSGVDSVELDFRISLDARDNFGPIRVDHFSQRVNVKAGESTRISVPLLLSPGGWGHSRLEADASDSGGQRIGSSTVDLSSLSRLGPQNLIAIFCKDHPACDEAQSQISFSGSEDDVAEKDRKFKFITLSAPRRQWWDYSAATFIVLAGSLSEWTAEQRFAVEAYARRGGLVVLLEKECAKAEFLAAYRTGGWATIGRGKLYRVPSLQSKELGVLFTGKNLKASGALSDGFQEAVGPFVADPLRRLAGVSFDFPRLRWFLFWLGAYILIIGLGNFALLRRLRRLEWGWLTTCGLAVLFAVGLYFISSSNRPKQVTLDDLVVYWMDSRSPNAWESVALRVSSPERQKLEAHVGDDSVLTSRSPGDSNAANVDIATEITREQHLQPGWEVRLGPPIQIEIPLLRWSYSDLDFQTFHRFSGTVTMDYNLRLKNGTGQQFREAMCLDFPENKKYLISSMRAGEELDLKTVSSTPIWIKVRRPAGAFTFESDEAPPMADPLPKGVFDLKRLPYSGFQLGGFSHVFLGTSDGPVPEAAISGPKFMQNNLSLTVVTLDQP